MSVDVAAVELWGNLVGAVSWSPEREVALFEYDRGFVTSGIEVAPLMMPLGDAIHSFPRLDRDTFNGLPGLLADSLPDRWGTALLNRWLARQGRPVDSYTPVELLQYIGTRGMGALEYRPAKRGMGRSERLTADSLADIANEMVHERVGVSAEFDEDGFQSLLQIGTSAGGMRAKAVIAWNPDTNEMRSGQVQAPEGFGYWIIKFDGIETSKETESVTMVDPKGYGRVEMAYHLMARDAGVAMSESRLEVDASGRAHFMTKRFDRGDDGSKVHAQTYQALTHRSYNEAGAHSWEEALGVTTNLCGFAATEQLYRRMVFNVMARNHDDHTKNIGYLMGRNGRWTLAPAYDVTYAHDPTSRWLGQHQMTMHGKRRDIDHDDLVAVARTTGVRRPQKIIAQVADAVSRWEHFAREADVDPAFRREIAANHRVDIALSP